MLLYYCLSSKVLLKVVLVRELVKNLASFMETPGSSALVGHYILS